MKMPISLVVAVLSLSIRVTHAWGAMAHEAIAYIAQDFANSRTATFVQTALSDTSTDYMANAATWADSYRYTSAGAWSEPLHFIDANDSPPMSCSVDFTRDCSGNGGCVVSAIANFTAQLQDSTTSAAELLNAMRFVIHFVGDIHQPLHDEALDVGGNSISVTYDGSTTNLVRNPPPQIIYDLDLFYRISNDSHSTTSGTRRSPNSWRAAARRAWRARSRRA
jgi:hypothetical protein